MDNVNEILNSRGQYMSVTLNNGNLIDTRFGATNTPFCGDSEFLDGTKCSACGADKGTFTF